MPIFTCRISWMMRSAEAIFGRRYRIAASSPCATAASAGNSQLPRWLGEDQRRLAVEPKLREQLDGVRGWISMRLSFRDGRDHIPRCDRDGRTRRRRGRDCPRRRREWPRFPPAISPGRRRSDWRGRSCCSRSTGPIRRVMRPNRSAVLIGIEIAGGAQHADGQRADRGFAKRLGRVAHTSRRSGKQRMHRWQAAPARPVRASGSARHSGRRSRTSSTSPRSHAHRAPCCRPRRTGSPDPGCRS